jgi:hypothetical protein
VLLRRPAMLLARGPYYPRGGVPKPPECVVTSHARRGRTSLHPPNVSGRRPRPSEAIEDLIPISDNVKRPSPALFDSYSSR